MFSGIRSTAVSKPDFHAASPLIFVPRIRLGSIGRRGKRFVNLPPIPYFSGVDSLRSRHPAVLHHIIPQRGAHADIGRSPYSRHRPGKGEGCWPAFSSRHRLNFGVDAGNKTQPHPQQANYAPLKPHEM